MFKQPNLRSARRVHRRQLAWGIETLEDRCLLASYPSGFVTDTIASGLSGVVVFDWAPDGRMFIGEKAGVVKVMQNGSVLSTPFVDLTAQVNNVSDRGLLGLAVHPQFPTQPYVYTLYTYDPPGTTPDAPYSRVARLTRHTADAASGYNRAVPGSEVVLLGTNSTLAHIPRPNERNPAQPACGPIGNYVRDCLPIDELSHTIGTVRFGLDGSLFVSNGDGGNYSAAQDYNVRSIDLNSLAGKILRIHPLTGDAYANNPFFDGDFGSNRSKVYSSGLRNPFRFTIDPVTGEPYIGDVGWVTWEELNRGRGANFGWPCYEGGNGTNVPLASYAAFPQCQQLYAAGNATPAFYAYQHVGGGNSVAAGAFYQGTSYPTAYRDALFIFDYSKQEIRTVTFGQNRVFSGVSTFATSVGGITHLQAGPDTNLYFCDILSGTIRRIRFAGSGNVAPTAVASMTQTGINTFAFSSVGSFDPNGDPLTYLWNFGDGTSSTLPNPTKTYAVAGTYTVTLRVTDPGGLFGVDNRLRPIAGNTPPVATMTSPAAGSRFRVGNTVTLTGSAVDAQDGTLPGSALRWNVRLHHGDHVHLDYFNGTGTNTSFVPTDHDDDSHYEVCLTATDSVGTSNTVCRRIYPETVTYTFNSIPSGLTLNYSGSNFVTPFQVEIPVNARRTIVAPASQPGGWSFQQWSSGAAATHTFTVAATPQNLVATYQNPSATGSLLALRASGTTGDELVQLQVNRVPVATYDLATVPLDYFYRHTGSVSASQVRIAFINDLYAPPVDRSVRVDRITIDGTQLQAEAPSVLSTGTWDAATGCAPGYKRSEELHCNGYFQFAAASVTSLITVRAAGDTGAELLQLQVNGQGVATFALNTSLQDYTHVHDAVVAPSALRLAFINDLYQPPIDRNIRIDRMTLNGVTYEAEASSVFSTGTWDPGSGCAPGYKQSEYLHCSGYFQFAAASSSTPIVVRAAGDTGEELIGLQVNQFTVATFALGRTMQDWTYVHTGSLTPDQVRVEFLNDGLSAQGQDRNVRVDRISLAGTIYETESPDVLSTGTWDNATGCGPGRKQSEYLHCSGYFQYGSPAPLQSTVVLRAAGTTGDELVRLSIDDRPVADYRLSRTMSNVTYRHAGPALNPNQVRVDFLNPGANAQGTTRRARIDRMMLNGSVYQTEAPQVYSTGTWSSGSGCSPGFKQSEFLQCRGFFQYGAVAPRGGPPDTRTIQAGVGEAPSDAVPEVLPSISVLSSMVMPDQVSEPTSKSRNRQVCGSPVEEQRHLPTPELQAGIVSTGFTFHTVKPIGPSASNRPDTDRPEQGRGASLFSEDAVDLLFASW